MKNSKIEPITPTYSKSQLVLLSILQNKKKMFNILVSFLLLSFIAGLSYYMWHKTKTKNYSTTTQALSNNSLDSSKSHLKKFKKIAASYPTLQPQLDGPLAQEYLNLGQVHTAKSFLTRVQKRQGSLLGFVSSFNEMTFLMEEHNYKEALKKGYEIKDQLKVSSHLKTLYTAHLLRLISLEQKLGHSEQKAVLMSEFLTLSTSQDQELNDAFQLGNLSVADYLINRDHL